MGVPSGVLAANRSAGSPPVARRVPQPSAGEQQLELLIRARYPVLYVVSWEEARVESALRAIAQRRNKQFFTWSITTGIREAGAEHSAASATRARSPETAVDAMTRVLEHKEPAIYLFYDLHLLTRSQFICSTPTIRKVREVSRALADSYKTMVICAPVLQLPTELEKDVTVVDFGLPGPAEIGNLLDRIVHDVKEHSSVVVDLDARGRENLVQAAGGLTLQEAENVFAKTLVADGALTNADVGIVFAEKQQIVRKSGLLEYFDADHGMDDVGGLENLKDWLSRRSRAFSDRARAFGLPPPKGVLLLGVQGCGKSLCAKAVSRLWNMPLLRFDVGRMFSSLVGSSESNIRQALAVAESVAPAILWVDEIDKAFAGTVGSAGSDGGTSSRVMSTFLTWLSEKTSDVFVVATANDIAHLPPELLRKGRLDEIFFVDLPSRAERRRILEVHIAKRGRDPKTIDLAALADAAEGFSGAELEQAVISALYDAFAAGRDLETEGLRRSVLETVPLSRTMSERLGALREWAKGRARPASPPPEARDAGPKARRLEIE